MVDEAQRGRTSSAERLGEGKDDAVDEAVLRVKSTGRPREREGAGQRKEATAGSGRPPNLSNRLPAK